MRDQLFLYWIYFLLFIPFLGIFEMILLLQFNRFYFRTGIPIFRKRYNLYGMHLENLPMETIEEYFTDLDFKCFKLDEYALRKAVKRKNIILTHGIIQLSPERNYIVIKGYANWLPLVILLWIGVFILILNNWSWDFLKSPFLWFVFIIIAISFLGEITNFKLVGWRLTGRF